MMEGAEDKQRRWKWDCGRESLEGGERESDSFENPKEGQGCEGDAERAYLLKNARSFLASTVSRRVSLPALVVTVSMVTV